MQEVLIINRGKLNSAQRIINQNLKKSGYLPINVFGINDAIGYFLRIKKAPDIILSEFSSHDFGEYFNIFKDRIGNIATLGIGPRISKNSHISMVIEEHRVRKNMTIDNQEFSFIDWGEVLKNFK